MFHAVQNCYWIAIYYKVKCLQLNIGIGGQCKHAEETYSISCMASGNVQYVEEKNLILRPKLLYNETFSLSRSTYFISIFQFKEFILSCMAFI